ncbi:MAG: hypothetical protein K8J31_15745, partial [Anaerolineae bacterium]|nr:hypothetical protein [Anaerolineae bacterium]
LQTYTDHNIRRSARLTRFNELFRAMFIDRHPAYPLYRAWYDLTEQSPEFPAPPTSEPTPQLDEAAAIAELDYHQDEPDAPRRPLRIPRVAVLGGLGGIALVTLIFVALNAPGDPNAGLSMTITATPTSGTPAAVIAEDGTPSSPATEETSASTSPQAVVMTDFATPTLRPTDSPPTATPTPLPVTDAPTLTATPQPTQTPSNTPTPSDTPTSTPSPTATLPAQGVQGRQDLLELARQMTAYPWDVEQFSPGSDGTSWRLGVGTSTGSDILYITLPPDLLETFYGNNAAARIRRLEATMTLTTFNPPLLLDEAVFFGALLQAADNPTATAGLQIQLMQAGVINMGQWVNGAVRTLSQRSVNAVAVRIRLERDTRTGTITLFFNDEQIGEPVQLAAADAPLVPVLFVRDGGVIVRVTEWRITLQ